MRRIVTVFIAAMAAASFSAAQTPGGKAELKDANGKVIGQATLTETAKGVAIHLILTGVPEGVHAFHIHTTGQCEPPFTTAGGHFNPEMKQHGKDNPMGRHAGDEANLTVTVSGQVMADQLEPMVTLKAGPTSLFDADGSALVVHATADDYKTDPTGNAGARIACGVITKS